MIRRRVGISTLVRHSTKAAGLLSNCRRLGPDITVCERFEKIDEVGFLLCGQLEVADLAVEQRQNLIAGKPNWKKRSANQCPQPDPVSGRKVIPTSRDYHWENIESLWG
jgi:hypothetical protein